MGRKFLVTIEEITPKNRYGDTSWGCLFLIFSPLILTFVGVLLYQLVGGAIRDHQFEKATNYSDDMFSVAIIEKIDSSEKSSYIDGCVISFKVKLKNNSSLSVLNIKGILVVYDSFGRELDVSNCTFKCELESGEETTLTLNMDRTLDENVRILYYSELDDLCATFKLTEVMYEGYKGREYTVDPMVVLEVKSRDKD